MDLEYFNHHYGFSYYSVSSTEIKVKFVNADGATIYQYTRTKHWSNKDLPTLLTADWYHLAKAKFVMKHSLVLDELYEYDVSKLNTVQSVYSLQWQMM